MQARTFTNLHRHTPRTLLETMVGTVSNGTMAGVSMSGMVTGVVEGIINPAPHIHEQMATSNYEKMATTLRTTLRITTSCLSTMR